MCQAPSYSELFEESHDVPQGYGPINHCQQPECRPKMHENGKDCEQLKQAEYLQHFCLP